MIARLQLFAATLAATALLTFGACKKAEEAPPAEPAPTEPAATDPAPTEPAPTEPAAGDTATTEDSIVAEISHEPAKEGDPVKVHFKTVKITKAEFDPANLEGATAEIEIDLTSLDSGVPKRNAHLNSPDYFDTAKLGVATVKVHDVKKGEGDKAYTAKADIDLHGVKKTIDLPFEVVDQTADSVRVTAEVPLKRTDFNIGKAEGDTAATDVVVKVQLTFKKAA